MQAESELRRFESAIDYSSDKERIKKFLLFYTEDGTCKYLDRLRGLNGGRKEDLEIDLNDVVLFDETGLGERIEENAFSYVKLITEIVDELLSEDLDENGGGGRKRAREVFMQQRLSRWKEKYGDKKLTEVLPGGLLWNYSISLIPLRRKEVLPVRGLNANCIGRLVTVRGIVTKISSISPGIKVATYVCESCGTETYQQIRGDAFDMLEECRSEKCRIRNIKGTLTLLTRGSTFVRTQSIVLQEMTGDAPHGTIPRSLRIECGPAVAGKVKPGEAIRISGIYLPKPYYGLRKLKAGLLNEAILYATNVTESGPIEEHSETLQHFSIDHLVASFAPEIYGLEYPKLVLLLALVGSPSLLRKDGMKIRGEINVLLLGDPGIAKSQLLKTAVKLSRRGVYVTGRGSSGVGLTAAVERDSASGDLVLDGGALVLADNGICCIDELDKMNEYDRVAIHEVMEQQTVSIAKAGINTTLNARCAVIAAANPVKGRYNQRRSLEQNSGLPCSLLSRFDVVCVLQDLPDPDSDAAMAEHVTSIHSSLNLDTPAYHALRYHIETARYINPILPPSLGTRLVQAYGQCRSFDATTPRTLLAMIRLSLAHARLRLSSEVESQDVDAAIDIIERMRLVAPPKDRGSTLQNIYNLIIALVKNTDDGRRVVLLQDIWDRCSYSRDAIEETIVSFESAGVWLRNNTELLILE